MAARYFIPKAPCRIEEAIKRSRFIASAAHAPDPGAAKAFIESVRAEFADATHNCWAFNAGPAGDTRQVGLSDDGEPHGTAGRPMLHTLLHSEVGEIAVVVTRYFGGIKLGTGGLTRAYSGLTAAVLEALDTRLKIETARLCALLDYPAVTQAKRLFAEHEAVILAEDYAERVTFTLELPEERAEGLVHALTELTGGRARVEPA